MLGSSEKLNNIKIKRSYGNDNFPNPVTTPICTVGVAGANTTLDSAQGGELHEKYTISINLYAPPHYTGQQCVLTLLAVSDILLAQNNGEYSRTCEIVGTTYNTTLKAYHAKLNLVLESDDGSISGSVCGSKVNLYVDGSCVAYAQSAAVKVQKSTFDVMIHNQSKPVDTVIIGTKYTLSIKNILKSSEIDDLSTLKDFTAEITAGTRKTIYSGCNVTECTEQVTNKSFYVQSCTITASSRTIQEV